MIDDGPTEDEQEQEQEPSPEESAEHARTCKIALDLLLEANEGDFVDMLPRFLSYYGLPWLFTPVLAPQLKRLHDTAYPAYYLGKLVPSLREMGVVAADLDRYLQGLAAAPPAHLTGTDMTAISETEYPPPRWIVEGLLHQGLTILAGKMKRGKSYLALDMAISVAFGHPAFRQLRTEACNVLYLSLEDDGALLQERLRKIHPTIRAFRNLTVAFDCPALGQGFLEELRYQVATHNYGLIIVDTLGRVLPEASTKRRSTEYQILTEALGPVQQWANAARVAVLFIDHVRKAEADDIFDTIMGSSAKMGVADHVIVYERKPHETEALLHLRGRRIGDDKMVLGLQEGHLEYLGSGERYDLTREQQRIMQALEDERLPMAIKELMLTLGIHQSAYPRFKRMLHRMQAKGLIDRTSKGLYCALRRADYDDSNISDEDIREFFSS